MGKPEIRFKGYTDEWEQRKLGELVGIYDGVHQTPDYQDSGIMFLSVENITTLKSEKYISEEAFERDYKVYPEKGDILMTRIGDVGTTNVVETAEKVAFYVSLALLKPNGIDSYFLSNAMKTNAFQKGLRERTLVTAIPQKINKDEIGKIDIVITNNDEEQKKIGAYFSNLDHLITLHQRKCDEVKSLKKYMLQKMFPQNEQKVPEIRFEGFTEAWEQRKVVEVAPLQRGFDLPSASMKPGKYPVVMSNGIGGYHFEYKVKGPGVVTGRSGTIGKLHYIEDDYWPHNTTLWVTDFNGNNQKFIYYLYQGLDLNRFGTGSGVPTLNRNDVHDAIVSVPSKNEQERISAYLTILDQLITLHQQKCEELKKIKKFMLQKMFV